MGRYRLVVTGGMQYCAAPRVVLDKEPCTRSGEGLDAGEAELVERVADRARVEDRGGADADGGLLPALATCPCPLQGTACGTEAPAFKPLACHRAADSVCPYHTPSS